MSARVYKPTEGPRVAISFAFATEAFEPPYFDASHLPLPPATVRAGLVSALAIYYVQNENPGQYRCKLYWDCFQAVVDQFDAAFAGKVETNFKATCPGYTMKC